MSKHNLHTCNEERCNVCDGGLALCNTCGGAEASLPEECPGRKMSELEQQSVQLGTLGYRDGQWYQKTPKVRTSLAETHWGRRVTK